MSKLLSGLILFVYVMLAQQATDSGVPSSHVVTPKHIGIVKMDVSEHSPIARATLSRVYRNDTNAKLLIDVEIANTTKQEIAYEGLGITFDLTDSSTGGRAPENAVGCAAHFFSECHTTRLGLPIYGPVLIKIPPNGTRTFGPYSMGDEYNVGVGKYIVQGYVCYLQQPSGAEECFKTNKIAVDVQ